MQNDNVQLLPMAEVAEKAVGSERFADRGGWRLLHSSSIRHAARQQGILPYVPVKRTVNNHGEGTLFDREHFLYQAERVTFPLPCKARPSLTQAASLQRQAVDLSRRYRRLWCLRD